MGLFDKLGKAMNRPRKTAVKNAEAPAPKKAKLNKNFLLESPASAKAPNTGALKAINKPTSELTDPIAKVLSASERSEAQ